MARQMGRIWRYTARNKMSIFACQLTMRDRTIGHMPMVQQWYPAPEPGRTHHQHNKPRTIAYPASQLPWHVAEITSSQTQCHQLLPGRFEITKESRSMSRDSSVKRPWPGRHNGARQPAEADEIGCVFVAVAIKTQPQTSPQACRAQTVTKSI